MTSRTVLAVVFLSLLAISSLGCPKKDGAASAEATGSATPAANAPKADDKEADKDDDEGEEDEADAKDKKDEGGW